MSASAWLKGHKAEAGLGAAGIVVTIALYVRSKGSSSASGAASTAAATPAAYSQPSGAYSGPIGNGAWEGNPFGQAGASTNATAADSNPSAVGGPQIDGYAPLTAAQAAQDIGPNYWGTVSTTPVYLEGQGGTFSPVTPQELPSVVGASGQLYETVGEFSNVPPAQYAS